MSFRCKQSGVRGASWRKRETLDLLAIWGEDEVQNALYTSHKNLDVYTNISQQMHELGHKKSAEECRTKAKMLRRDYRRVVEHNSQPGNSPLTCAYYDLLDPILGKDRSGLTTIIKKCAKTQRYKPGEKPKENLPAPCFADPFRTARGTINPDDLRTSTVVPTSSSVSYSGNVYADSPETFSPNPVPSGSGSSVSSHANVCEDSLETSPQNPGPSGNEYATPGLRNEDDSDEEDGLVQAGQTAEGPDRAAVQVKPQHTKEAQLENEKGRQRRVALLNDVAVQMMEQGKFEHMETMQRLDGWLQLEERKFYAILEEGERDRRALQEANQKNVDVLMAAVNAIHQLGEALSGIQSPTLPRDHPCVHSSEPEKGNTSYKDFCAAKRMLPEDILEVLVEDSEQEAAPQRQALNPWAAAVPAGCPLALDAQLLQQQKWKQFCMCYPHSCVAMNTEIMFITAYAGLLMVKDCAVLDKCRESIHFQIPKCFTFQRT